jgi:hypothetical protein
MRTRLIRWNLYLGIGILSASIWLLNADISFMRTWFYLFAWWPFILIIDSVNYRRTGASLFLEPHNEFLFMAFVSVSVWLIFELFNLRLNNWSYHDLPDSLIERWLGYFLAFSSVIPALSVLSRLFGSMLEKRRPVVFRIHSGIGLRLAVAGAGLVCLAAAGIWPQLFFPGLWLGFVALLDPVNYTLGNPSILRDLEAQNGIRLWSWLAAGLTAGFFWELFNFWAGSHWEYSLPYFEFGRVFQMPVLGYLGFLPFALEVMAMYGILTYARRRWGRRIQYRLPLGLLLLALDAVVFMLLDKHTWVR